MPSIKNIQILEQIQQKLQKAKAIIIVNSTGLSVAQQNNLRNQLKEVNGEIKVYKNTLLKLALKNQGYKVEDINKNLSGPSTIVFGYSNEIGPVKKVYDFAKLNEMPEFKFGFLGKEFMAADRVKQLGELPSKEILLAKLIGSLNSPLFNLANVLQGNVRKLVFVLS